MGTQHEDDVEFAEALAIVREQDLEAHTDPDGHTRLRPSWRKARARRMEQQARHQAGAERRMERAEAKRLRRMQARASSGH